MLRKRTEYSLSHSPQKETDSNAEKPNTTATLSSEFNTYSTYSNGAFCGSTLTNTSEQSTTSQEQNPLYAPLSARDEDRKHHKKTKRIPRISSGSGQINEIDSDKAVFHTSPMRFVQKANPYLTSSSLNFVTELSDSPSDSD